jgi:hypothetical protein
MILANSYGEQERMRIGKFAVAYAGWVMVDMQTEHGITAKTVKTCEQWAELIITVTTRVFTVSEMTIREWEDYLINISYSIYENYPKSFAGTELRHYYQEEEHQRQKDKFWKTVTTVGMILVSVLAALTLPVSAAAAAVIGTKIKGIGEKLADPQTYIDAGTSVAEDTIQKFLNAQRGEVLKWLDALDDKTFLELSSVTDKISDGISDTIRYVSDGFGKVTKELLTSIIDKQSAMDKALATAESNERVALESINHKIGEGVIDSYLSAFFERVT